MVCLSSRPGTEKLVRVGARIAGRLATNWYAVYVARPNEDQGHGDPEAFHRLQDAQRMARDLGRRLVPGGTVVLAGLLTNQVRMVLAAHRRHGMVLERAMTEGRWATLILRRRG